LLFIFAAANLFFPPIPLETAALFAGCLSGNGHGSTVVIIVAAVCGMSGSSLLLYHLTKNHGLNILNKTPLLKNFMTTALYRKIICWFTKYGIYTLFLGKLVPGMSLYTVICCGLLRLETTKTLTAIFFSNLFFYTALVMTGYILGAKWGHALPWLTQIGLISMAAMVVFTIFMLIHYWVHRNKT
jgi:membrane protein DedA with SNARE-associated domain